MNAHQTGARLDPVRLHYLAVLSERVEGASGEVRRILQDKLDKALADCAERERLDQQTSQTPKEAAIDPPLPAGKALAELNQYIRQATQHPIGASGLEGEHGGATDTRSARRFRATWSKIAAERQVDTALGRGPENAGPLNAHMLVLHSLSLMRQLSPDYLTRFMSHVDTLLWLDQVNQKLTLTDAKPARQGKPRK